MQNLFSRRGRGRGRGRGRDGEISGARKKILAKREERRREDLENAIRFKQEREAKK